MLVMFFSCVMSTFSSKVTTNEMEHPKITVVEVNALKHKEEEAFSTASYARHNESK